MRLTAVFHMQTGVSKSVWGIEFHLTNTTHSFFCQPTKMLKSIKDYTKRHRKGLLITATIIGGGIFAGQYARNKIQELQDKAASERMAKEKYVYASMFDIEPTKPNSSFTA
jgi:Peroxin-3